MEKSIKKEQITYAVVKELNWHNEEIRNKAIKIVDNIVNILEDNDIRLDIENPVEDYENLDSLWQAIKSARIVFLTNKTLGRDLYLDKNTDIKIINSEFQKCVDVILKSKENKKKFKHLFKIIFPASKINLLKFIKEFDKLNINQ